MGSYASPNHLELSALLLATFFSACSPIIGGVTPAPLEEPCTSAVTEVCDGHDNDCDGQLDEGVKYTFYGDRDGDGYGDLSQTTWACAPPEGYATLGGDCDDNDPLETPGRAESCDGHDNDCDGQIDEGVESTFFPDQDGDGYGLSGLTVTACTPPTGYVPLRGDCDDLNASIFPGALDPRGDGIDQDCGGADGAQPSVGLELSKFGTLQAAMDAAQEGETVWVGPGTYLEHALTMRGKSIAVSSTGGADQTVIQGQRLGSVFLFTAREGPNAALRGLTLTGGYAAKGGGISLTSASPTLEELILRENVATEKGGGFYFEGGSPTLRRSQVLNNTCANCVGGGGFVGEEGTARFEDVSFQANAAVQGGGLAAVNAAGKLLRTSFSRNQAMDVGLGGGIYLLESHPTVENCILEENSAMGSDSYGGGMYMEASSPTLTQVTLVDNTSMYAAGGMSLNDSSPILTEVNLTGNSADIVGGGMHLNDSSPILTQVSLEGNSTSGTLHGFGGGMYLYASNPILTQVTLEGNSTDGIYLGSGAGMYLASSSPILTNVILKGNRANGDVTEGGGMYLAYSSPTLTQVTLEDNWATEGGGMNLVNSSPTLTGVSFMGNAAFGGGGMWMEGSNPTLTQVVFEENHANGGGGMYLHASTPILTRVTLVGNKAAFGGGGVTLLESSPTLTQVGFVGNEVEGETGTGGGMALYASSPTVTQALFVGNVAAVGGGGYLADSDSTPLLVNVILAYNEGYNLFVASEPPATPTLRHCDLYAVPGQQNHNLSSLDPTTLTVEPGFLLYADALPVEFHLATTSPLVNAGDPALIDKDGSRSDLGIYGGLEASGWDRDQDGYYDWFWPGTLEDAPTGFEAGEWDADDGNATVH